MINKISKMFFFGIVFLHILSSQTWSGEVLIVVNKSVLAETIDRQALADIYLGNKTRWDNGDKIRVVMLKYGPAHEIFTRDILGITPSRLRDLWKKALFTGKGTPPKIRKNEEDIVNIISETKGAIGYIDSSTEHEQLKVLTLE